MVQVYRGRLRSTGEEVAVHDLNGMQTPFLRVWVDVQVYRGRLRSTGEEVAVHDLNGMQTPF